MARDSYALDAEVGAITRTRRRAPLAAQLDAVVRAGLSRRIVLDRLVGDGRMTAEGAARERRTLADAVDSLDWLLRHAGAVRGFIEARAKFERDRRSEAEGAP